jgi:hypothetical protein
MSRADQNESDSAPQILSRGNAHLSVRHSRYLAEQAPIPYARFWLEGFAFTFVLAIPIMAVLTIALILPIGLVVGLLSMLGIPGDAAAGVIILLEWPAIWVGYVWQRARTWRKRP